MSGQKWLQQQKEKKAVCRYCGTHKELTVDHIRPKCKGGQNNKYNYQVLCKFCNGQKSGKLEKEIAWIFRDIKERGVWYEWEYRYQGWLNYIECKREEYGQPPLNW